MCHVMHNGERMAGGHPPRLEPCIELPLGDEELADVVDKAKDWALMHGVCMRSKSEFNRDALQFAPFVLTPSAFPAAEFRKAVELQPILNELTHRVAHDESFLRESLASTLVVDPFTAGLFDIWEKVLSEGSAQPTSLGLFRSDYLLHTDAGNRIKQVEINTIASSFGGISAVLTFFHSYILQQLGHGDKVKNLPPNNALNGLCTGMTDAWDIFNVPKAIILFIVEDVTYNICDQRFHEFEISERRPEIKVVRKTLTEMSKQATLDNNRNLYVNDLMVGVVYYRAGYEPNHYPSEKEWGARLLIERSTAIKCPSIHYHLAGTKKVQQALAKENTLERFIKDPEKVEKVREIFTGLYSLDFDEFGDQAIKMAMENAEKYVLKPQREGGGNNIYGADIKTALMKMGDSAERSAYILMERICPPICRGYVVRPGQKGFPVITDLVSELGIFGVIIGTESEIMVNRQVGHMLRTKQSDANEGGVAAGLGALDSPYLIDM